MLTIPEKLATVCLIILIAAGAWTLQNHFILNWDVSWLMHAANRLLGGGTYRNNFFETNPPLIFYLYLPALFFKNHLAISFFSALQFYIFLLAFLSLYLCYHYFSAYFPQKDDRLVIILLISLASIFLILPTGDFGQREHLFILLALPYFFLGALRLDKPNLSPPLTCLTGLLAGIGFAIKPHFLVSFVLIEIYFMLRTHRLTSWMRRETLVVLAILIAYPFIVWLTTPDYFSLIMPYAWRLYYEGISNPWSLLFYNYDQIFFYFVILFYLLCYPSNCYRTFSTTLFILFLSCIIIAISQRTLFSYHYLPALSVAILMITFLFSIRVQATQQTKLDYGLMALFSLLALLFIGNKTFAAAMLPFLNKTILLGYLSGLLAIIFFLKTTSFTNTLVSVLVGIILFAFPLCLVVANSANSMQNKALLQPYFYYLKTQAANKSVYYFATVPLLAFPTVDYTQTHSVSRFPFFWMLPGLLKQEDLPVNHPAHAQFVKDKDFFISMICDDLSAQKPDFVLVDVSAHKRHLESRKFDYLPYFSSNTCFPPIWEHYRYLTTFNFATTNENDAFQLAIYQRKG